MALELQLLKREKWAELASIEDVYHQLLIHSADVAETIKSAHVFGLNVEGFSVDFRTIVEQVNHIVDLQSEKIRKSFEGKENPKLFANECKFVGEKIISIETGGNSSHHNSSSGNGYNETIMITADKILITSVPGREFQKLIVLKKVVISQVMKLCVLTNSRKF